jgi:hypothetical protein
VQPVELGTIKTIWLKALEQCEAFINCRPATEVGCLYYSKQRSVFVMPSTGEDIVPHYGSPGGIIPSFLEGYNSTAWLQTVAHGPRSGG